MVYPFEWQECGPRSHAIPYSHDRRPLPGDEVRTLCGGTFTLVRDDFRRDHPNLSTCSDCMHAWARVQEAR